MHLRHRLALCRLTAVLLWTVPGMLALPGDSHAAPLHVYLVLGEEASTQMGVHYHTLDTAAGSFVHYDTAPRGGDPLAYAFTAEGVYRTIDGLADGRQIHGVMLTGLTPHTVYYFVAGDSQAGYSAEKSFRTPPGGNAPIRFVVGGDMDSVPATGALAARAAQLDPSFAVIGGDIAYADGSLGNIGRWDAWFALWADRMVTSGGHMIPMVLAIGNHEVNTLASTDPKVRAPFYTGFFWNQGDNPYFVRRIGGAVCFIVLDSNHLVSLADQVGFLQTELASHAGFPWKFPVYHVAMYPGHRDFDGPEQQAGRALWAPLFEQYGVRYAFEHHDHVLKRTHPIRAGAIDPTGVVYVGDGCFGTGPRTVEPRWYLDIVESKQHFWFVEVDGDAIRLSAIDLEGNVYGDDIVQPDPLAAFPERDPAAPLAGAVGLALLSATLIAMGMRRRG